MGIRTSVRETFVLFSLWLVALTMPRDSARQAGNDAESDAWTMAAESLDW